MSDYHNNDNMDDFNAWFDWSPWEDMPGFPSFLSHTSQQSGGVPLLFAPISLPSLFEVDEYGSRSPNYYPGPTRQGPQRVRGHHHAPAPSPWREQARGSVPEEMGRQATNTRRHRRASESNRRALPDLRRPAGHGNRANTQGPASRADQFVASHTERLTAANTTQTTNETCPICMEGPTEHECVRITGFPNCSHMMGLVCLKAWLDNNPDAQKLCPMCRLEWMPEETHGMVWQQWPSAGHPSGHPGGQTVGQPGGHQHAHDDFLWRGNRNHARPLSRVFPGGAGSGWRLNRNSSNIQAYGYSSRTTNELDGSHTTYEYWTPDDSGASLQSGRGTRRRGNW